MQQTWAGALPPPVLFAQYEQILPGAAERILAMAETATTGEISLQRRLTDGELEAAKSGQGMAFFLTLVALVMACVFFALGNRWAGTAFVSFPVIMLIRSFITRS